MPVLPDGWELDYDGSRWVYRFTASGLTQYQFPKPGDEFSEFAGIGDSFVMAPEDCLASDRQVKQQSTDDVGNNATKPSAARRKKRFVEDMKEVEAAEYLDTEKFMYLGPGLFTGSNAFGDQQARTKLEAKHSDTEFRKPPSSTGEEAKATPTGRPIADNLVNENYGTAQEPPPRVAGGASKGAKPREGNAATDTTHSIQTKLSMQSPVGFVAELASHEIRKQETHMPDIEPGVPKRSMAGGLDVGFNGPVELPTYGNPMKTRQPRTQEATLASAPLADSYPLVSATFAFAFPPLPPKHPVNPPKTASFSKSTMPPQKSSSWQIPRPLSCHEPRMSRGTDPGDEPNRSETQFATIPEIPTLPALTGVKPQEPKRHSFQGSGPVATLPCRYPISPMPSSDLESPGSSGVIDFQNHRTTHSAPRVPPKIPLSPANTKPDSFINTARIPGSEARHDSISSDTSQAFTSGLRTSGLVQCPSVLRPGYYRWSATNPPQLNQQPSVLAVRDGQQAHRQHLPHILPIQRSRHAHEPLTLQAKMKPQWDGGHVFEEPVVHMPDERDFAVRPTATTRGVSEPVIVPSPTTLSSPKSPSKGPGLMIFHEIGPISSKRKSETVPTTSRAGESWTKDIHELGCDRPLPTELPSDEGTNTKPDQPLPFVAPLRFSPPASRRQGELSPSAASAAHELAATPLLQREHSWSTRNPNNSAQADPSSLSRITNSTAGAGGTRQHAPEAVDTMPLRPASRPALSRATNGASGASLSDPQAPSPLTRPASLAQSEVSCPSVSNASLHQGPISAPRTRPSAAESLETVPRYTSKQIPTQGRQTADVPPAVGKARGSSAWSTLSSNYSGDEWGENWYEECPGIVPEYYLPT